MNDLHLSSRGAKLIQAFESCLMPSGAGNYRAYLDPIGIPTIGWGHTNHHGRPFKMGDVWTRAECDAEFESDMTHFENAVKFLVTVELNQNQFDALVSFAYNCGDGNLSHSTLLRKLNSGNSEGAALEFPRWNRAGGKVLRGLIRRRASEALLFQGIDDLDFDGKPDRMPQQIDAPI